MTGPETADVVVVGGGAMGSAAAYFLMLENAGLRVVVCEQDPSYASSATLNAAGGIRQTFALAENVRMSRFGAEFLRDAPDLLAVDDDRPDIGFHARPYLYLASGDADTERLRQSAQARTDEGAPADWLDRGMLERRFPWLSADDVEAGMLGGDDEGVFDPESLLRAFKRKAIALGAVYRQGRVVGFDAARGRLAAVRLDTGDVITCGIVINAAGASAATVAALVGCLVPIQPRLATTFIFQSAAPVADMPIIVDRVQHLHIRPEGDRFLGSITGTSTPGENDADTDRFTDILWPALAHRIPAFEAIRFAGSWTGTIDASPFDGNPMIGPHPAFGNFLFLAGFNGHGLQHAPAAGRAIAEWIVHGGYRSIDLRRFGLERLSDPPGAVEYF